MNESARNPAQASSSFETLRWREDGLELIDQRLLPMRIEYVRCTCAEDVATAIHSMVVRGAPAIGCAAAYGVALEALRLCNLPAQAFLDGMEHAFQSLLKSRPTAVNLAWAVERQRRKLHVESAAGASAAAASLLAEAHLILAQDIEINHAMGRHGAALIPDGARVLTHCNAGALATGGHGTALGVIRSAIEAGKSVSVFADETRPLLQGARLTAWELMRDGVEVVLIADSAAAFLMSRGEIDVVIVGADRVAANGDTANKIGTYPLAVLAQRHGIPFYVACPLSTIDLSIAHGMLIPIEERASDEIVELAGQRLAPPGVAVRNPAFDVTPAQLVSVLITERGIVRQPDRTRLAALF